MTLTGLDVQHYKARAYHPAMGRFIQPDPIGYGDGMYLYAYVGNDPVNNIDPTGLAGLKSKQKPRDAPPRFNGGDLRWGWRTQPDAYNAPIVARNPSRRGTSERSSGGGDIITRHNVGASTSSEVGDEIVVTRKRSVSSWLFGNGFWYPNYSGGRGSATGQIQNSPQFAAASDRAWEESNPNAESHAEEREVAFTAVVRWLSLLPTVTIYCCDYGKYGENSVTHSFIPFVRPHEALVLFHTHPFVTGDRPGGYIYNPGVSGADVEAVNKQGAYGVIRNHSGHEWFGACPF